MLLLTTCVFVLLIARALACGYLIDPPHTCTNAMVALKIQQISQLRQHTLTLLLEIIKDFDLDTFATFDISKGLVDNPLDQENAFFLSLDSIIKYTW